jgi:adenine-specific DNA-methyltransferase
MGVGISYMGTKQGLAPLVKQVIDQAKPGILLDAFSGMCSVGEEVGASRQVWANDAQLFASEVARALFASDDEPPNSTWVADQHHKVYGSQCRKTSSYFSKSLECERELLEASNFETFLALKNRLMTILSMEAAAAPGRAYNLFSTIYADTYLGVAQAIEVDSIIFSINEAESLRVITGDQRRWLMISLGRALLKLSTSTGHFAQFLTAKSHNYERFVRQRKRKVWMDWIASIGEMIVVGSIKWRKGNRVFNEDSVALLRRLKKNKIRPSVIYADPPYTDDQYSRFYHLLETLMLYDYPEVTGMARYRSGRFRTDFSLRGQAVEAFESLVSSAATLGADFVLSYPSNGLLYSLGSSPSGIMKKYFRKVQCSIEIDHMHSTFGASKGAANACVREQIFWAKS